MTQLNQGVITGASDDSVRSDYATFGFVLCDRLKERLIRGRGPAPGAEPNSLRAEAYGALAVVRMLFHLSRYTDQPLSQPLQ